LSISLLRDIAAERLVSIVQNAPTAVWSEGDASQLSTIGSDLRHLLMGLFGDSPIEEVSGDRKLDRTEKHKP